ncbi:hypothetical protein [Mesorhizobium sp.]|uniref:hypothetical protein n=1 Tax=Mesorhizobium sp. TaxID=1871066 RepID=UPI000FD4524B|nr:hypothetical protein [Mesorhizobium sp.]RVC64055.1 hypothetical protein EN779_03070 [Mesorhizobium sp. M4B.F.Ca.ET.088.02.2.1]RWF32408.1 MAG: hypothetical protein EOS45_06730 [Mesorhizobium sp.]
MPNITVPAAGEAMPAVEGMQITGRFSRRAMLLGALASVPAIGGAAAAVASPVSSIPVPDRRALLQAYNEWLFYERLLLMPAIHPDARDPYREADFVPCNTLATHYHFPLRQSGDTRPAWEIPASPATRAFLVLSTVGMDFRPLGERS